MPLSASHLAAINKNRKSDGRFGSWSHDLPGTSLADRLGESGTRSLIRSPEYRARIEQLKAGGYAPAGAVDDPFDPATTARRDEWWELAYAQAEQGSGRPLEVMPDDYTPHMTRGDAISGHRRTHRIRYTGAGVDVRMPSRTSINRWADDIDGRTFDMPVEAHYPGGTFHGHVRITRGAGGSWEVDTLGARTEEEAAYVAESVASVLEARRARTALRDTRDLLAKRRERLANAGIRTDVSPKNESSTLQHLGYNKFSGEVYLHLQSRGGKSYTYGYEGVDAETVGNVYRAKSPMAAYNALIKGRFERFELRNCNHCHRVYNSSRPHQCHTGHDRFDESTVPVHRLAFVEHATRRAEAMACRA